MPQFRERLLLSSKALKNEVLIAFGLILLVLLVFLGYLFPGVFSVFSHRDSIPIIAVIIFFLVGLGFLIVLQIAQSIVRVSQEARRIANGDLNREIKLFRGDEIGQLGEALNRMTQRLRENVDELQKFSKTTETINREINKNIVILSNLLQVSHLITQNAQLKEVIEVGVKCLSSGAMTFAALILKDWETSDFLVKYVSGGENVEFAQEDLLKTRIKLGEGLLGKALLKPTLTLLDQNSAKSSEIENFRKIFPLLNAVLTPVTSKGNVFGLLVAGNNTPQFVCSSMDSELLQIIAQQLSIAITNDLLTKEIEKLAVVDKLTGLYNQNFIRTRLAEEIKRAVQFQRPCSFVLITIDRFRSFHEAAGRIAAENILIRVAGVLKEIKDEAIKTARFGDHEFALIFPEKSKRQSLQLSEEIKEKIEQVFQQGERQQNSLLCRVVVTENPLDGNSAEELIAKAEKLLKANS